MDIYIPIGKTNVCIEALQQQIDVLKREGYPTELDIPFQSYLHVYIKNNKIQKTFAFKI